MARSNGDCGTLTVVPGTFAGRFSFAIGATPAVLTNTRGEFRKKRDTTKIHEALEVRVQVRGTVRMRVF